MKRPGPRDKSEVAELAALSELPTTVVALVVEAALATIVSETAIVPLLHSLARVTSLVILQVHPSVTFLQFSHPSSSPESQISSSI